MKKSRNILFFFIASILVASAASQKGVTPDNNLSVPIDPEDLEEVSADDTIYVWKPDTTINYLPGEVRDTAEFFRKDATHRNYDSRIHLLARSYGDSIVLRWAPEDYVSWQYLNAVGVNIYRISLPDGKKQNDAIRFDTLAMNLKPATLERFRAIYPETDSVAAIALGTLYSEGGFTQDQSRYGTGEMGALLDVYNDQQFRFGMAVLASEWRKDLAEMLAMRFVDRNVKKMAKYRYIVRPAEFDSTKNLIFRVGYMVEYPLRARALRSSYGRLGCGYQPVAYLVGKDRAILIVRHPPPRYG